MGNCGKGCRLGIALTFFLIGTGAWADACRPDQVLVRGDWGQARFTVEIADDEQERNQGLMHRESMPRSSGMLFVYPQPGSVGFWMRNTLIPLDMIFVDKAGTVRHVHHNAIPHDETPIQGGDGILVVLEINGGMAQTLGIVEGSQMQHPAFDQADAVWPC